ncbi:unnamed protein product, partial [Staurois parvus]
MPVIGIFLLSSCHTDTPQRHLSVSISALCQCSSVPHQCHISVPTSAHQCHISVPIRAAFQCHPLVPVSATYQCQSVPPINAA